jgi:signal transduction histidine kinase
MGARTLEARLTSRLLALGGGVLVAVGIAAVVVTDRVLDASDTAAARAQAAVARDAIERELGEGDPLGEAIQEAVLDAHAQGARLAVRRAEGEPRAITSGGVLPELAPGACATVSDEHAQPWRACSAADKQRTVVAAISIAAHRAAIGALSRGMAAVVVAALFALWLAVRGALRAPVAELTSLVGWTEHIVDTEKASDPPVSRTREIAQLQAAFDALVRRLLGALVRERANSAHIAHELRTPLTAVMAELEGARAADDASRHSIARVREGLARLADVIEAILVLSDGAPPAARGEAVVNVADLARELTPAGARVEAPDEALIEGDERLVSLATRNLVDNARKYGAGVRLVRVSRDGSAVRLAVIDGGPGLDAAARERMFERYWRGAADGDGRGLGLALVRAIAERHGGRAEARPGPEGRGLEVAMTLGQAVGWNE